jgi:hypothetical protein
MTESLLLKRSVLQSHHLFSSLSELTIMSLVSEIFQVRTFRKDDIILYQNQYSPTLKQSKIYLQNRVSKFAEKIKTKKVKGKKCVTHLAARVVDSPQRKQESTTGDYSH